MIEYGWLEPALISENNLVLQSMLDARETRSRVRVVRSTSFKLYIPMIEKRVRRSIHHVK